MDNKVVATVIAGGIVVGAAFVASAVSSPDPAIAQEENGETRPEGPFPRVLRFLEEILDDLVGEDTLTQDQADAVLEAAEEKASELKAGIRENRELLEGLLEDGVITKDETADLPEDHFLFDDRFDEAWEDGELSAEDLGGLHRHWRRPFRHGLRLGALLDDGGIDRSEYNALPDDHPLKRATVTEYLEDGQITPDELREIFSGLKDSRSDGDT